MSGDMHFARTGSEAQEPFRYLACGLDNVFLNSGFRRREREGQWMTAVEDAEGLHAAIAMYLVLHKKQLSGKEVRFLRKHLDLSQADLGHLLGLTDQSIARYEKEQTLLEGAADMLLRLLVVGQDSGALDPIKIVEQIRSSDDATQSTIVLEHEGDFWRAAA